MKTEGFHPAEVWCRTQDAVDQLRQFARLRNRREMGWSRLDVRQSPSGEWWSEFKSLDDMVSMVYLNNGVSRENRQRWLDCAKLALRRKQRQAGFRPDPAPNEHDTNRPKPVNRSAKPGGENGEEVQA